MFKVSSALCLIRRIAGIECRCSACTCPARDNETRHLFSEYGGVSCRCGMWRPRFWRTLLQDWPLAKEWDYSHPSRDGLDM